MKIMAFVLLSLVALAAPAAAESVARTFPVSLDRAWSTTEKVLRILGWEVDKADRAVGWITTESRKLDGEDYGVYAKGTRHRLRSLHPRYIADFRSPKSINILGLLDVHFVNPVPVDPSLGKG